MRPAVAVALTLVARLAVGCTDEEPITIRGCPLSRLDLVAFEGRDRCAAQDPGHVASGEARATLARATWDDPGEGGAPELDVGDADAVTVVARCMDEAGAVRLWGCDDDADDRLEIDLAPVCHAGGCGLDAGACAARSVPWSGGGGEVCVAECEGCDTAPCATGDPLANDGCDWTCNDPLAPELLLTALTITAPAALAEDGPQELVDEALASGELVWLIAVGLDGSFRTGVGTCDGSDCAFSAEDAQVAAGEAAFDPGTGALRLPAEGSADLDLVSLPAPSEDPLHLEELTLTATIGNDGNCIGARTERGWEVAGEIRSKITVDEAEGIDIEGLGSSLCDYLAGTGCADGDPESWPRPPDTDVGGDPAWTLSADIAAIGVEIP